MEPADDDRVASSRWALPPHGALGVTDEPVTEEVVRRQKDPAAPRHRGSEQLTAHLGRDAGGSRSTTMSVTLSVLRRHLDQLAGGRDAPTALAVLRSGDVWMSPKAEPQEPEDDGSNPGMPHGPAADGGDAEPGRRPRRGEATAATQTQSPASARVASPWELTREVLEATEGWEDRGARRQQRAAGSRRATPDS